MKRAITLLLTAAMLLSAVGCSNASSDETQNNAVDTSADDTTQTDDMTTSGEGETEAETAALLPARDFGGRDFRISCNQKYSSEMAVEEMTGDICNDAVYNRNIKIEELYKVKVVPVICSGTGNEDQVNEVIKTITSGEDLYDLVGVYTYVAGRAVTRGCYHSWNNVPNVDFSKEWWVQSANESFSIGGDRYVAVGDLSITTLLLSYAVFFNQQLAVNYNFPNLYETVLNGEWTIDKLKELSQTVYKDTNGNGAVDKDDLFGFAGEVVTNLDVYPSAFDIPLVKHDEAGIPYVDIDMERMASAMEAVYNLYYNNGDSTFVYPAGDEIPVFAQGRVAFLTTWIDNAFTTFREMEDDYGILPYPKLNEAQENYYGNSMDNYSLLSVPVTVKTEDLDFVGYITEAMTIENHNSVVPTYYDVALTEKYARDEDSVRMLDIIMDGRLYDFSILHSTELGNLPYMFRNTIAEKSTDFASTYAKSKKMISKSMDKLVKSYMTMKEQQG